jgi:putative endonuclease
VTCSNRKTDSLIDYCALKSRLTGSLGNSLAAAIGTVLEASATLAPIPWPAPARTIVSRSTFDEDLNFRMDVTAALTDIDDRRWFVYLLLCRGERIYCGVTPDLDRRIAAHRRGKGAKFTRINPPERLLAVKSCSGKIVAMQLEAQIKRLQRAAKLALAETWLRAESVDELSAQCFPAA